MEECGREIQEESESCGDNEVKEKFLAVCYIPGVTWPSRGDKVRGGTSVTPTPHARRRGPGKDTTGDIFMGPVIFFTVIAA